MSFCLFCHFFPSFSKCPESKLQKKVSKLKDTLFYISVPWEEIKLTLLWNTMGSRIMLSIGSWDQIYPCFQVPNYFFIPNVWWSSFSYYYQPVIRISLSMFQSDPIKGLPLYDWWKIFYLFLKYYYIVVIQDESADESVPLRQGGVGRFSQHDQVCNFTKLDMITLHFKEMMQIFSARSGL